MLGMGLSLGERALYTLKWLAMLRWETAAARRFDRAIVVSEPERDALRRSDPRLAVSIVENGVDAAALSPLPEPPVTDTLLFVGTFTYRPNVDAALLLGREIFPLVRRAFPAARLLLVGHEPPDAVRALGRELGVSLAGAVPDVRRAYERAAVAVAPLRAGGGTRLKILEAMALGRPVVSTRVGAEGLDVADGNDLLLADAPGDFAKAVARLLGDRPLRARLAANARRLVEARYDWARPGDALLDVYRGLAARPATNALERIAEEAV
jgi:glycosyltransferase involved in cell wall biosynthesis